MIELPYLLVQTVVYAVIIYAMIGFQWNAAKSLWYMFTMYFHLLDYTYYGMMVIALTLNQQVAYTVSTAIYGVWSLFGGLLIPRPVSFSNLIIIEFFIFSSFLVHKIHEPCTPLNFIPKSLNIIYS